MQYQHPGWGGKPKRGAWKKYAGAAGILILAIAGVLLIPGWLKAARISLPGFPSPTPRSPDLAVTRLPSPEQTARAFLDGWKADDYSGMYSLLSSAGRDAMTEEEFRKYYSHIHNEATLQSLDYRILSIDTTPTDATVAFEVTLDTILFGDITSQTRMLLKSQQGGWQVAWDGQTVLPELEDGNTLVLLRDWPARGNILERNGLALAADAEAVEIGVVPGEITEEDTVLTYLARVLDMPREMIRQMVAGAPPEEYVPIGDVNLEDMEIGVAALSNLGGVYVRTSAMRYYYGGGVASHVVGYTRKISPEMLAEYQSRGYSGSETVGATGLEKTLEQDLAGKPGGSLLVTSPDGTTLTVLAKSEPSAAMEITTALDRDLQAQIERTVMGPFNGAVVVLNRNTGEVLAMMSSKRFDSNLFNPESYHGPFLLGDLQSDPDSPLVNRATMGEYPLGSVFKIITMAAGLESGLFVPGSVFDDADGYFYGCDGFVGTDWTIEKDMQPHGKLTLEQCLARSCNPCLWHVGEELYYQEPWRVPNMAKAFGLGTATGIPGVEEQDGLVPDPTWKRDTEGVDWTCGDALNQAIGQGMLQVTPLQVADFTAAVGNGGTLYRPQILLAIGPPGGDPVFAFSPAARGQLPVQPENLQAIQRAMRAVVNDPKGTAYARFRGISDIVKIAGKTGTAQSGSADPHSWFVAFTFEEGSEKPDIAVAVIAEYSGEGSYYAARMVRRVIEIYFLGRPTTRYPWESEYGMRGTDTPTETEEPTPTPTDTPENTP